MDFPQKKSEQSKIIRSLFSAIKKDNLNVVEELLKLYPVLLYFKNNKRENLLFYAFEHNSKNVIDYIHLLDPTLVKEKNILNLNILHELILQQKDVTYFLENMKYWEINDIQQLFLNTDPQGNNALLMAAKVGDINVLNQVISSCPFFPNIQKNSNYYGQTIAHFIASSVTEDCKEIISKINPELMNCLDNINGFSPLMLAAFYQQKNNFQAFFELHPHNQVSIINNHLMHFAASNPDSEVTNFLIENNCFTNEKNNLNETPLYIALTKNNDEVAQSIFNEARKNIINQEEIVASAKMSSLNPNLFQTILKNETNESLNDLNRQAFLEQVFLHGMFNDVLDVTKSTEFSGLLKKDNSFTSLFAKALTGKKDMGLKTNYLLGFKNVLTTEETISTVISLAKLPFNQINFILKTTKLLDFVLPENKSLFVSLCLGKGLDYHFINPSLSVNTDSNVQRLTKSLFKSSRIESSQLHLANLEKWLQLFNDKRVVWKHYGRIIAKNDNPFNFLDKNFKELSREHKKELVYYTITALFKNEKPLDSESLRIISQHKNLLKNVFIGIVKFGKVPYNKGLLELVPQEEEKLLSSEDFIYFTHKTQKKPKEAINTLKKTIDMFDFSKIKNMTDFCGAIRSNIFHDEILEELSEKLEFHRNDFIFEYLTQYVGDADMLINMEKVEKILCGSKNCLQIIDQILKLAIETPNFKNIEFIKRLCEIRESPSILEYSYIENLVNVGEYQAVVKIQKTLGKCFDFKSIDFTAFNWQSIDSQIITKSTHMSFFDFISHNRKVITSKQLEILTSRLVDDFTDSQLSFETIKKFLVALDDKVHKIPDELLLKISSYVLEQQHLKDVMMRYMSQESFDTIFNLVAQHKNGKFLELIQKNEGFKLIKKETQIQINKQVLNDSLNVVTPSPKKEKRMKI